MKLRPMLAEFIGTCIFVFASVLVAVQFIYQWHPINAPEGAPGLRGLDINFPWTSPSVVAVGLATGLILACMAAVTARVSGGHLNPAVSIAMVVTGRMTIVDAVGYIVAQVIGSFAGALLAGAVMTKDLVGNGMPGWIEQGRLPFHMTEGKVWILEAVMTFVLVMIVLATMVDKKNDKLGPLWLGLFVAAASMVALPYSGASFNPARFIGPSFVGGGSDQMQVYLLAPLAGGVLAGIIWHYVLAPKDDEPAAAASS